MKVLWLLREMVQLYLTDRIISLETFMKTFIKTSHFIYSEM